MTPATKKRNLFAELTEGFDALTQSRQGKLTLRTHKAPVAIAPTISATDLVSLREQLGMSRPVFAQYLRTNPRTLENWEQGRARPNAQAALLIKLVAKYPDTIERLAEI
jgi:putative transcriptional regulator